jgi:hypothetical protein
VVLIVPFVPQKSKSLIVLLLVLHAKKARPLKAELTWSTANVKLSAAFGAIAERPPTIQIAESIALAASNKKPDPKLIPVSISLLIPTKSSRLIVTRTRVLCKFSGLENSMMFVNSTFPREVTARIL